MYYSRGVPISTLRFMGRWTVEKSLEHYIQLAMSAQTMNKLTPSVISRLKRLSPLCLSLVVPSDGHAYLAPLTAEEQKSSAASASWCSRYAALEGKACWEGCCWRSSERAQVFWSEPGTARLCRQAISCWLEVTKVCQSNHCLYGTGWPWARTSKNQNLVCRLLSANKLRHSTNPLVDRGGDQCWMGAIGWRYVAHCWWFWLRLLWFLYSSLAWLRSAQKCSSKWCVLCFDALQVFWCCCWKAFWMNWYTRLNFQSDKPCLPI